MIFASRFTNPEPVQRSPQDRPFVYITPAICLTGRYLTAPSCETPCFQFQVGVGQVIPGWDLTLLNMQQGEQRTVILPPDLAYGKEGVAGIVPPDSPLRFDIELVEILPPRPVSP